MDKKPILCLDFDGVCHSYTSGWKGADNCPDLPVPGLQEFLAQALEHFDVYILSSRSHQEGGKLAMYQWFTRHCGDDIAGNLRFPSEKPPAHVTLDDRGLTFTGQWPSMEMLINFKPWNKR